MTSGAEGAGVGVATTIADGAGVGAGVGATGAIAGGAVAGAGETVLDDALEAAMGRGGLVSIPLAVATHSLTEGFAG